MDSQDWFALLAGAGAWLVVLGSLLGAAIVLDVKAQRRNRSELP